jgi:hypothetical protein
MTHREYTLTVESTIYESLDSTTRAAHKIPGETMVLNQEDFDRIKGGQDIIRYTTAGHGMTASITFGKENFANEVTYTEVTVSTGAAKLGKRKNKTAKGDNAQKDIIENSGSAMAAVKDAQLMDCAKFYKRYEEDLEWNEVDNLSDFNEGTVNLLYHGTDASVAILFLNGGFIDWSYCS